MEFSQYVKDALLNTENNKPRDISLKLKDSADATLDEQDKYILQTITWKHQSKDYFSNAETKEESLKNINSFY